MEIWLGMKKNCLKKLVLSVICVFNVFLLFSQSTFSGLDLDAENTLIFTEEKFTTSENSHKNLYKATIQSKIENQAISENPKLLTCYPENMNILNGGKLLEIYNAEGIAQYSVSENTLTWTQQNPINQSSGIFPKTEISPDGNWIVYYEKTTPAKAKVILKNVSSNQTLTLTENTEFSNESVPVKWSKDSSILIYEKNNNLYFLDVKEFSNINMISESNRKIGVGSINSVHWANEKFFIYINHDMVYKIATNELYTRSLYADMAGSGNVIGRLPTPMNSTNDQFWTDTEGTHIVLIQGNKTLWYIELNGIDYNYSTPVFSYPFITVPNGAVSFYVFWTPEDKGVQNPFVWIEILESGKKKSYVYKLVTSKENKNAYFETINLPTFVSSPKISPDGKTLAFLDEKNLHIYDIFTWKQKAFYSQEKIVSYQWIDKNALYLGGTETVSYWEPYTDNSVVLFLSQATKYGFNGETGLIVAENGKGNFYFNEENNTWEKTENQITRLPSTQNPFWRVFLSSSKNADYANGIYIRTLAGLSETRPLLKDFLTTKAKQPSIALVFDALDNADGITYILDVLSKYNLKATFFINGEFIRRYPTCVTEIVNAGHECASMFFTTADLTNSSYVVDESFIRRGLARTEDEFFALTGKELSLYWHTPFYKVTNAIINGGKQAGYTLVTPTTKQLDMQTLEDTSKNSTIYYSSTKIIEGIFKVLKDKAIIPVSVGLSNGTRTDYLYNKVDVLISAILEKGYKIVPVSQLDIE